MLSGIVTLVNFSPFIYKSAPLLHGFEDRLGKESVSHCSSVPVYFTFVSFLQPENAFCPMLVMLAGNVISVIPLQSANA